MSDFSKNFQTLFLINVNPAGTESLKRLAAGISSVTPSSNDETDDAAYLDGEGAKTTTVTGMQRQYDFSGSRDDADEAQNFVAGLIGKVGKDRETTFKLYHRDGSSVYGACTIQDIVEFGGDADAKADFTFTLKMNGKTTDVAKLSAPALGATFAAGTTIGTTKATATPGVGNALFYKITETAQTASANAYESEDNLTAYTSADEIAVTAGEFVNLYEMSEFKRIIKFDSHEMAAGEIAAE
jgi:hypothetical protein